VESSTVVASGGDEGSLAAWLTLLNADVAFRARMVAADDGSGKLRVTTLRKGNVRLRLSLNLDTGYATDDGSSSSNEAAGTEADVRVIMQDRDLVDLDGASFDSRPVATIKAGRFDESELSNLSDEAKAILLGRGSTFE
jgi:hypothetical protein